MFIKRFRNHHDEWDYQFPEKVENPLVFSKGAVAKKLENRIARSDVLNSDTLLLKSKPLYHKDNLWRSEIYVLRMIQGHTTEEQEVLEVDVLARFLTTDL